MIILSVRILCETLAELSHTAYSDLKIASDPGTSLRFAEWVMPAGFEQENSRFANALMIEAGQQTLPQHSFDVLIS
jgi:hypothetical protein